MLCSVAFAVAFLVVGEISRASVPDPAGQEAAGIVARVDQVKGGKLSYNSKTRRLEVRDEAGALLDELATGTTGKVVDVGGQEYRLSFGLDDEGRRSLILRPGPAMRKPITAEVLGRKVVLSPEASLVATMGNQRDVFYEPSICGQIYYIDVNGKNGTTVAILATPN